MAVENSKDPRKAKSGKRFNSTTWKDARNKLADPIRKQGFENYLAAEMGSLAKARYAHIVSKAERMRGLYNNEGLRKDYLIQKRIVRTRLPRFLNASLQAPKESPKVKEVKIDLAPKAIKRAPASNEGEQFIRDIQFHFFEKPVIEKKLAAIETRKNLDQARYAQIRSLREPVGSVSRSNKAILRQNSNPNLAKWRAYREFEPEEAVSSEVRFDNPLQVKMFLESERKRKKNNRC